MEKLYKVVCANFAITDKSTGKCDSAFEDSVDEALMAFVGLIYREAPVKSIARFIGLDQQIIHDLYNRFSRKKSYRFKIKLGLVQNGIRRSMDS